MTERVKAPEAANARAKIVIRQRYRALRRGKRVDSPAILAGRLIAYAEDTAKAYPVESSRVLREHIENSFHERFIELCKVAPVAARRS